MARVRGKIRNAKLMVQVLRIALKLVEGFRSSILKAGRRRAMMMSEVFRKPGGVFIWAPQVRHWLNDATFVRYLGVLQVNP